MGNRALPHSNDCSERLLIDCSFQGELNGNPMSKYLKGVCRTLLHICDEVLLCKNS